MPSVFNTVNADHMIHCSVNILYRSILYAQHSGSSISLNANHMILREVMCLKFIEQLANNQVQLLNDKHQPMHFTLNNILV